MRCTYFNNRKINKHKAQATFRMQKLIFIINLKLRVRFRVLKMTWLFNLVLFRGWDLRYPSRDQCQASSTRVGNQVQALSWAQVDQRVTWCVQCQATKREASRSDPRPRCPRRWRTLLLSRRLQARIKWSYLTCNRGSSISRHMISQSLSCRILCLLPVLARHSI